MRVLMKKYEEESKVQCINCETLLAYGKSDIYNEDEELFGVWHNYTYVVCPICSKRIILTIDGNIF